MQKLLRFMRLGRVSFVLVLCLALVHVALGTDGYGAD